MAKNDFKAFSVAGGANVLTQAEYEALAALSTGFTSGKANAKDINKVLRQASFIAAALAQFVSDKAAVDVLDDGSQSGFITKLTDALNKTSQPLDATLTALAGLIGAANKLPYFNGADTATLTDLTQVGRDIIGKSDIASVLQYLGLSLALRVSGDSDATYLLSPDISKSIFIGNNGSWGVIANGNAIPLPLTSGGLGSTTASGGRANLGLGTSAVKNTGTGTGQIPDMSSWTSGGNLDTGWRKTPDGWIEQWGVTTQTTSDIQVLFPIPFTTAVSTLTEHDLNVSSNPRLTLWQFTSLNVSGFVAQNIGVVTRGEASMTAPVLAGCRWFARGK